MSPRSTDCNRADTMVKRPKNAFLVFMTLVQFALQVATWVSLARRPQDDINGPKWFWFAASFVNYLGPIAYLMGGRKIT